MIRLDYIMKKVFSPTITKKPSQCLGTNIYIVFFLLKCLQWKKLLRFFYLQTRTERSLDDDVTSFLNTQQKLLNGGILCVRRRRVSVLLLNRPDFHDGRGRVLAEDVRLFRRHHRAGRRRTAGDGLRHLYLWTREVSP